MYHWCSLDPYLKVWRYLSQYFLFLNQSSCLLYKYNFRVNRGSDEEYLPPEEHTFEVQVEKDVRKVCCCSKNNVGSISLYSFIHITLKQDVYKNILEISVKFISWSLWAIRVFEVWYSYSLIEKTSHDWVYSSW